MSGTICRVGSTVFPMCKNLILDSTIFFYLAQNAIRMDGVAQLTESALLEKIRQTRSETELAHLIESSYQQLSDSNPPDRWNQFSALVVQKINAINPLFIEDPIEWDILRRARVLIYRQSLQMVS